MIKKFKNGNILMSTKKDIIRGYYDSDNIENFYHDECFMNDITFTYIDGVAYFIDCNTGLVYDSPYYLFTDFIIHMYTKKKLRIYPYGRKMSRELFYKYLDNIDYQEVFTMTYVIAFHLLTGALVLILSQIDIKEIDE